MAINLYKSKITILAFVLVMSVLLPGICNAQDPDDAYNQRTSDAANLCNQATGFMTNHNYAKAMDLLKQAISLDPNDNSGIVHSNYAMLLEKTGQMDNAIEHFKIALNYDPSISYNLGCCYEHIGDVQQALKYLTQYVNDFPKDPNRNEILATLDSLKRIKPSVVEDKDSQDYLKSVTSDGIEVWPRNAMPLKVFIHGQENIPDFPQSFTDIPAACLDQWARAASNYCSWKMISNEKDADIVFNWISDTKQLEHQGAEQGETSRVYRPTQDGRCILNHAIIKLCIFVPVTGELLSYKLLNASCLHEIGHALGLKGHSPSHKDVMFYGAGESQALNTLSARDIATINRLYETYQP